MTRDVERMSTSQIKTCSHVAPLKQNNDDILRREPAEVVDMALGKLQTAGIVLLEWLALLYRRMNVPVIIKARIFISSIPAPMVISQ